jgi:hypothetical protein
MGLVICDMSTSLDGYVTGPNDIREKPFGDSAGMLHAWTLEGVGGRGRESQHAWRWCSRTLVRAWTTGHTDPSSPRLPTRSDARSTPQQSAQRETTCCYQLEVAT